MQQCLLLARLSTLDQTVFSPSAWMETAQRSLRDHGGSLASSSQGEMLAVFAAPAHAVNGAVAWLRAVDAELEARNLRRRYGARAAVHTWNDEHSSAPLDELRAMLNQASEHSITLSPELHHALGQSAELPFTLVRKSDGNFELAWDESATTFRLQTQVMSSTENDVHGAITLTRSGVSRRITAQDCPLSIGRERGCGLVLGGGNVSRQHGSFLYERGRFHYRDESRNGTYLVFAGKEMYVCDSRIALSGAGAISPGVPLAEQRGEILRFSCES